MRQGIEKVIAKTRANYLPEDVYHALRSNTAWAFALRDDNADDFGFMVLQNQYDPDGLALFVWCLWVEPNAGPPHRASLYEELENLAKSVAAKRIRLQSPRKGWEREPFFKPIAMVYEHECS